MDTEQQTPDANSGIPNDAIVILQSSWAWIWAGVPWIILALIAGFWDAITFGVLPIILAVAVIIPRYLGWRGTRYILTEDHVILQKGMLGGSQKYDLPVTDFRRVTARYGLFGRSLGYQAVDITLRGGGKAPMTYVPTSVGLVNRIEAMMHAAGVVPEPLEDAVEGAGAIADSQAEDLAAPRDDSPDTGDDGRNAPGTQDLLDEQSKDVQDLLDRDTKDKPS